MRILVINGPNVNVIGIKEPEVYGNYAYDSLRQMIMKKAAKDDILVELFQSNHEGAIIDKLQECCTDKPDGIIINPGALSHYSYSIHDALKCLPDVAKVEVHLSDIMHREDWRKILVTAPACNHLIYGNGLDGYIDAMDFIENRVRNEREESM